MKTFSFTTIIATFLFIFYNGIQAQNIPNHVEFTKLQGIQKLDSIIYETLDTITNQWIFSGYEEYTHDYTWNADGKVYLMNSYCGFYPNNDWIIQKKYESVYDDNWNLTLRISYNWDYLARLMVLYSKEEYSYDDIGNLILKIYYPWDKSTSQWVPTVKNEYTHDTNGNKNSCYSYYWNKAMSQWINSSKSESACDANGKLTEYTNYNWDSNTSQWIINTKYTLDTNRNTILFIDSDYSGQFKLEYTYDGNGNLILIVPYYRKKI